MEREIQTLNPTPITLPNAQETPLEMRENTSEGNVFSWDKDSFFKKLKEKYKEKFSDCYDEDMHDHILEELAETLFQIKRYEYLIDNNRESKEILVLIKEARIHYRELLNLLVLSIQSMKKTKRDETMNHAQVQALLKMSNTVDVLRGIVLELLSKIPETDRDKYLSILENLVSEERDNNATESV